MDQGMAILKFLDLGESPKMYQRTESTSIWTFATRRDNDFNLQKPFLRTPKLTPKDLKVKLVWDIDK